MSIILWLLGAAAFVVGGVWWFAREVTRPTLAEEEGVLNEFEGEEEPGERARLSMKLSDIQDARKRSNALPICIFAGGCAVLFLQAVRLFFW